jgi:hypothetical protein
MNPRVRTATEPGLIPYVTLRQGEEGAPDNLTIRIGPGRRPRLHYRDQAPEDRDVRGVLWGRCSQNRRDKRNMPTGTPLWRLMHPARQRETMQSLLCQVCVQPARTPSGWIFLAGPDDYEPDDTTVITAQPPVCVRHVRAAARLCPYLDGRPMVFLVQSAPLYGVHGTLYGYGQGGVHVIAQPDFPLPYGHHNLPTFLASQLVRRLRSFRLVDLDELMQHLQQVA